MNFSHTGRSYSTMRAVLRSCRSWLAFVHDLIMVPIAWFLAYYVRFNLQPLPPEDLRIALLVLPVVWVAQGSMFWAFGLYRGIWRFASMADLVRIVKAASMGTLISVLAIFLLYRLEGVPRSVFLLDGMLLVFLLGGPRFCYRLLKDRHFPRNEQKRALIIGAGRAGEMLVRDMMRDTQNTFHPVAFADDAPRNRGREIHGVRVIGACDQIPEIVSRCDIDLIVIAVPTATSRQLRRLVEICEKTEVPFRIVPQIRDLVSGEISVRALREVRIEDLLGRQQIELDWSALEHGCRDKTILVTGGGGSIGAELCRQIAQFSPAQLIVFERGENSLFALELDLRRRFPSLKLTCVLGDVCDGSAVQQALRSHRPEVIFHAAAFKHVALLEGQVRAAIVNNIFGTKTVASLADRYGVERFVLISTDKAVNPCSVLGATKRAAEMICQGLSNRSMTKYMIVRFGNVLGSSGSVIPLFHEQIARGGPVTVTHPDVMRYFMTIPEACQLILQATVLGEGGEVFVLDMGDPVKIAYLAERVIRLTGKVPGEDIEIAFTGLRPGEKLQEELFMDSEGRAPTSHPKILRACPRKISVEDLEDRLAIIEKEVQDEDKQRLIVLLSELVTTYSQPCESE